MSPSNTSPKAEGPLEALGSLAHWLAHTIALVAIGALLGIAAARLLRSKSLHWSWAGGALLIAGLLRSACASLAPMLLAAALCATMRGRRSHREDVEAGADLADVAARRRRPIDLLHAGVAALAVRRRRAPNGSWFRGSEMIVGRDERGRLVSIPFGGPHGGTHTLLVGATGSGKTVTQTWMAVRAIERGMGAIVIDPKGDRDMRAAVARAADGAGRRFIEWTPQGPSVYNPFAHGSETQIADKVLAGERFTEPHYLRQAQRLLGHVVRSLRAAGVEVDLHTIARHLDPTRLELLVRTLPANDAQATEHYLDSLTARQLSEITGVRDRLAILAESDVGPWLDPFGTGRSRFDLLEAVERRHVVYFELDADSRPLLTQMLGAAIVGDLQTTVASLQGRPTPTIVVIDEFSALAAEHVVRLFGRARSAGLSLVLSTQELSDLRLHGREALLEQVMGNLTVVLSHRQVVPGSAELIASLAGSKGAWKTSRNGAGRVSRTRVRERALSPDAVTDLGLGWVAAIVLSDDREARLAHVLSLDEGR
jgi:Type IV secretion-system coupling protein DNA-binding domain